LLVSAIKNIVPSGGVDRKITNSLQRLPGRAE